MIVCRIITNITITTQALLAARSQVFIQKIRNNQIPEVTLNSLHAKEEKEIVGYITMAQMVSNCGLRTKRGPRRIWRDPRAVETHFKKPRFFRIF